MKKKDETLKEVVGKVMDNRQIIHVPTESSARFFMLKLLVEEMPKEVKPGQFIMIKPLAPGYIWRRPFSVADWQLIRRDKNGMSGIMTIFYKVRGNNTIAMSKLAVNGKINFIGPLGQPVKFDSKVKDYWLVAGGIGVAGLMPIGKELLRKNKNVLLFMGAKTANEAFPFMGSDLAKTFSDYQKSIVEELDGVVTDLLEKVFKKLKKGEKPTIIACGPAAMLAKVSEMAEAHGCPVLVGLEKRFACGLGGCLGCTIRLRNGELKQICADGQFLNGVEVDWEYYFNSLPPAEKLIIPTRGSTLRKLSHNAKAKQADRFRVEIKGKDNRVLTLPFPSITSSGTQTATSLKHLDQTYLGAITSKGICEFPWAGNPYQRLFESAGQPMNSIGLQNVGIDEFIKEDLPRLQSFGLPIIVNFWGKTIEEYINVAKKLRGHKIAAVEANISCDNVHAGGLQFGCSMDAVGQITVGVREVLPDMFFIIKLGPTSPYKEAAAVACNAGADAASLINTIPGMMINLHTRRLEFKSGRAGMSGPSIHSAAVKAVLDIHSIMPAIGMGGISGPEDAIEIMLAGAQAYAVGTEGMVDPSIFTKIHQGMTWYMDEYGYARASDMVGDIKQ